VIDFTDLEGGSSELGKYIAEQLTVNLVLAKQDFSVLDRANLKSILAEHKLTATGLIDPDNAKKLGMFAGVDALILGTIIPKGQNINLTAKIITTDTAEIIGAARAGFKKDEAVQELLSKPANKAGGSTGIFDTDAAKVLKSFGDLRIEAQSLKVAQNRQFLLTLLLANQNAKKSIWVALGSDNGGNVKGVITDSEGSEFNCESQSVSGIEATALQNNGFFHATEIKPSDSISAIVKFYSRAGRTATPGSARLQLEFLVGSGFNGGFGSAKAFNLVSKIETNE